VLSVRVVSLSATFVAGIVSLLAFAPQALAQGGAAVAPRAAQAGTVPSGGTNVVVIDIAKVFKNHNRFNAAMNDIKKDIEGFDGYVRSEQTRFNTLREQLQTFKSGSLEYKNKEEEIAKLQSDLQVKIGLKRKEFLEQEARVYYYVYKEIEQSVASFSSRNRIGLVLRYNGEEMKEDDRASVLQGVNRAVVFQQNLDITDFIIVDLNRGTQPPPASSGAGGAARVNSAAAPVPRALK
jgi:hypothetical protein